MGKAKWEKKIINNIMLSLARFCAHHPPMTRLLTWKQLWAFLKVTSNKQGPPPGNWTLDGIVAVLLVTCNT